MKILKTDEYIDLISKLEMYKELLRVERIFTEKQERQIEEMKNCHNCQNFRKDYNLCLYSGGDEEYFCRLRKWELTE